MLGDADHDSLEALLRRESTTARFEAGTSPSA
jgi:hypothetical protein